MRGVKIEEATSWLEKMSGKIEVENLYPSWLIFADGISAQLDVHRASARTFDCDLSDWTDPDRAACASDRAGDHA